MTDVMGRSIYALMVALIMGWTSSVNASLIINEIMYDPVSVSDTLGEWFEIYNPDGELDLQNYAISDSSATVLISSPLIIGAGDYLVFGKQGEVSNNGGVDVGYTFSFSLNNSSAETLSIMNPEGGIVDQVTFGSGSGFPTASGASIYFSGQGDHHDGSNWLHAGDLGVTYGDGDYGTPGRVNIAAVPEPSSLLLIASGILGILMPKPKAH